MCFCFLSKVVCVHKFNNITWRSSFFVSVRRRRLRLMIWLLALLCLFLFLVLLLTLLFVLFFLNFFLLLFWWLVMSVFRCISVWCFCSPCWFNNKMSIENTFISLMTMMLIVSSFDVVYYHFFCCCCVFWCTMCGYFIFIFDLLSYKWRQCHRKLIVRLYIVVVAIVPRLSALSLCLFLFRNIINSFLLYCMYFNYENFFVFVLQLRFVNCYCNRLLHLVSLSLFVCIAVVLVFSLSLPLFNFLNITMQLIFSAFFTSLTLLFRLNGEYFLIAINCLFLFFFFFGVEVHICLCARVYMFLV